MRAWGEPGTRTLEEYFPHTQEQVARLFQLALERSRRLTYNSAVGSLHLHAIDIWPSATTAAVDFYPLRVSFEYDRERWRPGETFRAASGWSTILPRRFRTARLSWKLEGPDGRVRAKNGQVVGAHPECGLKAETVLWHPNIMNRRSRRDLLTVTC